MRDPLPESRDVSVPIDHATTCQVMFCARVATRVAVDGDGYPFALCEAHRPFARFMGRAPD